MTARIVLLAVILSLGLMVAPSAVPALEDVSIVENAEAAKCVAGFHPDCIVTLPCPYDCH